MLPKNLFKNGFDLGNEPIEIDSLDHIRNFISDNFKKIKNINTKVGSRKLKDMVERDIGIQNIFVNNGELIASMILEGYEYRRDGKNSPNANFNLSQGSVKPFL